MVRATPWHHLNSSVLPHPHPHSKQPSRSYPTSICLVNVAEPENPPANLLSAPSIPFSTISSLGYLNELNSLASVKAMHAHFIKTSKMWKLDNELQSLITAYSKLGDFQSAALLYFVSTGQNHRYSNNFLEIFKRYGGNPHEILQVFRHLQSKGVSFDSRAVGIVLKVCANLMYLWLGLEIHAYLIKAGLDMDVCSKGALMDFYGCHDIDSCNRALAEMSGQEILLWNKAIVMNLRHKKWLNVLQLFQNMQFSSIKANSLTISRALQACGKLGAIYEGKQIHGYAIRSALDSDIFICNLLINMYSKTGNLEHARAAFDAMENRNVSSWNSMISAYTASGYLDEAFKLFHEMEVSSLKPDIITCNSLLSGHCFCGSYDGVLTVLRRMIASNMKPNSSSIPSVLQAVSRLQFAKFGKEIHGYVVKNDLDHDVYVGTSLVDMYVKNYSLSDAQAVFDGMKNRNIFAWNALISGYSFKGYFEEAENMLNRMENEGIKPDRVTYNALVSGYSIWGCTKKALAVIREIKNSGLTPNVVSWTALISGCSQNGNYKEALEFFIQMQREGVDPNSATISCLLRACAGLSLLQKGKEIHCLSIRSNFAGDLFVDTALIDMYSKSGSLRNAQNVFQKIQNKTLASWNSLITGFGIYGLAKDAISLFEEMQKAHIVPDAITFTALLSCCKHSGLIKQGWRFFDSMNADYAINPSIEHYSCMVDLLGRVGYLDEAWDFIQKMPLVPDAAVWGALLEACRTHDNLELAEIAAKNLFKLEPHNAANYYLLMGLHATLNKWEDVESLGNMMGEMGVKTGNVWSWIQINQTVHVFAAKGKPHPDEGMIYFELHQLISEIKSSGYVPDIKCVYQNSSKEEREKILLAHTEKLAITYGLMKTKGTAPIRVIKNSRMCSDCHTAAKYTSLIRDREIYLKDGVRFHHFMKGRCSCNDFW